MLKKARAAMTFTGVELPDANGSEQARTSANEPQWLTADGNLLVPVGKRVCFQSKGGYPADAVAHPAPPAERFAPVRARSRP